MWCVIKRQTYSIHTRERENPAYCEVVHHNWKFTPWLDNKAEKITGCVCWATERHSADQWQRITLAQKQKWNTAYIYSLVQSQPKPWETFCLHFSHCIGVYACVHLCPLEGVNFRTSSHPCTKHDWNRASETTATNCSVSVRQMGGRGSHVGGVNSVCQEPQRVESHLTWVSFLFFFCYVSCTAFLPIPAHTASLWWDTRPCTTSIRRLQSFQIPARAPTAATSPAWGSLPGALELWMFPWGTGDMREGRLEG